ncbi:MAG: RluA family pseudouridine synthase [Treponema sp.]|nr:RluA family pseudouridine synthase [Treponema sp.]
MELTTGENDKGRRLDKILRKALPDHPLALIHRLLRRRKVLVNGKPAKADDRIDCNVKITILSLKENPSPLQQQLPLRQHLPVRQQLQIIWEGEGLIAINKPSGLAVHGPDSLDTLVGSYLIGKISKSLSFKPGPLHRLDKPSSGIVVFSTSLEGAHIFSLAMRQRKIQKTYLAIVKGIVKKEEIWHDELVRDKARKKTFLTTENNSKDAKHAITKVIPLASKNGFSLIQVEITTGRTHQIRTQAAAHGYPLLGDVKYGGMGNDQRMTSYKSASLRQKTQFYLHAWRLTFLGQLIEAQIPDEFSKKLAELGLAD